MNDWGYGWTALNESRKKAPRGQTINTQGRFAIGWSIGLAVIWTLVFIAVITYLTDPGSFNYHSWFVKFLIGFLCLAVIGLLIWKKNSKLPAGYESLTKGLKLFPLHRPLVRRLLGIIILCAVALIILCRNQATDSSLGSPVMTICGMTIFFLLLFPCSTAVGFSMEPTILSGDALIGERLIELGFGSYHRGDIISFYARNDIFKFIPQEVLNELKIFKTAISTIKGVLLNKRIVAVANDRVEIKAGQLYINDQAFQKTGQWIYL